jgi:hypothetical protein
MKYREAGFFGGGGGEGSCVTEHGSDVWATVACAKIFLLFDMNGVTKKRAFYVPERSFMYVTVPC